MKRHANFMLVAVAASSIAAVADHVRAADVGAGAGSDVIVPISIVETAQMNYGILSPGQTGGVIRIIGDGEGGVQPIIKSGDIQIVSEASIERGRFQVTGEPNATFSLAFPNQSSISDGAGNSMTMDNFTTGASLIIRSDGMRPLGVDADLHVSANQAANIYTGTYTLVVAYN